LSHPNIASQKILRSVGFKQTSLIHRFNADRALFELTAKQVKYAYDRFFTRRDKQKAKEEMLRRFNEHVDVTTDEMLQSDFGRHSRK